MPICIPKTLPAASALTEENIFFMTQKRASSQDIRPLQILIVNLMPRKIETETQLLRLLSNSPLQINIELLQMATHKSKNTSKEHLFRFYSTFSEIKDMKFDGMIVTGAPVETIPFESIDYWNELCQIFEWSKKNVFSRIFLCWGAAAGLYYHYKINKIILSEKIFGVFSHTLSEPNNKLLRGFDDLFFAPHSRYFTLSEEELNASNHLKILAASKKAGPHLIESCDKRDYFVTGHWEYDRFTLHNEYLRDIDKDKNFPIPYGYYPDDDVSKTPTFSWRSHANLFFCNWLNYVIYQDVPYNLSEI